MAEPCNCPCCQQGIEAPHEYHLERRPMVAQRDMRAEFMAWAQDQGCDTDGAWSAWQGCWNLLTAHGVAAAPAPSRLYACPYCDQREGWAHGEHCRGAGTMVKRPAGVGIPAVSKPE